jgi:hypothetical protein
MDASQTSSDDGRQRATAAKAPEEKCDTSVALPVHAVSSRTEKVRVSVVLTVWQKRPAHRRLNGKLGLPFSDASSMEQISGYAYVQPLLQPSNPGLNSIHTLRPPYAQLPTDGARQLACSPHTPVFSASTHELDKSNAVAAIISEHHRVMVVFFGERATGGGGVGWWNVE